MNLTAATYWSTQEPFLDRFKLAEQWHVGNTPTLASVDANGNPTAIPSSTGFLTTLFAIDPQALATTDQYVLTYQGTGTIDVGANKLSVQPGQIVFDASNLKSATVNISMWSTDPNDPIRDIHVVRADQVGLFNSGEIFNPAFIEKVSQWGVVRFMDWGNTNDSGAVNWANRADEANASWATPNSPDGVPLEVMVKLANEAHVDMWYNMPTQADDNYVRNALTYIRDHLESGLKVHVEYSNEVWNWGMATSHYALEQAQKLWGHDVNGDGKIANDPSEMSHNWMEYYGYRAAQVAAIGNEVFGNSAALVNVIGGQQAYAALTDYTLSGIAMAGKGAVSSLFDQYAITAYFGTELDGYSAQDQATVLQWARSGAAGIDTAFREMQSGGLLQNDYSLTAIMAHYRQHAQIAAQNGLSLVAYEGGAHLTAVSYDAGVQDEIAAFFGKLMNDPRMGDLYTRMVSDFASAGGQELVAFSDVGTNSRYGYWGVLDDIYSTGSPRYDALVDAAAAGHVAVAPVSPLVGTAGADNLMATGAGGTLAGLGGNDTLTAAGGNDILDGGDGNDILYGTSSTTTAGGLMVENDYYFGGGGNDTVVGGIGNDHIYGNALTAAAGAVDGADSLLGGAGNDYVQGNAGNDTIDGGIGNDRLYGGNDNDLMSGGDGWDYLQGNKGMDTLFGGYGRDTLRGGANNDQLAGDFDDDQLFGDEGNDMLSGNWGVDTLTGGVGGDFFLFSGSDAGFAVTGANAWRMDEITDFQDGIDSIGLNFRVASVVQGAAGSAQAAFAQAQLLLVGRGASVAAMQVGSDTYLFYDGDGVGGLVDSGIKVDHVAASAFDARGYDFLS